MDVLWDDLFEWDSDKDAANYAKHRIHFSTATAVFDDDDRLEFYDTAHSEFEDRYSTIGKVNDILFVVYTERKERIRLISARPATPAERRWYHAGHL